MLSPWRGSLGPSVSVVCVYNSGSKLACWCHQSEEKEAVPEKTAIASQVVDYYPFCHIPIYMQCFRIMQIGEGQEFSF